MYVYEEGMGKAFEVVVWIVPFCITEIVSLLFV